MMDDIENNVLYTSKSADYSLLVVPKEGFRLYGSFAFQLLYGRANVNGYECTGKKLSPRYLMCVSAPAAGIALHVTPLSASPTGFSFVNKAEVKALLDSLASRLRSLVDKPSVILTLVSKAAFSGIPIAVIVIKHEMDVASRFIAQQHTEPIFKAPFKAASKNIGRSCFLALNNTSGFQESYVPLHQSHSLYQPSEMSVINGILDRVYQVGKMGMPNRVMVVGKKNVGKSTLLHYLANQLLNVRKVASDDGSSFWMKRLFLLDCDVGQSELSPSGVISLNEITVPFLGAAFSRQVPTLCNAYFFGSPSPSVDFPLYRRLVKMAFDDYLRISGNEGKESVLLINTLGWIEDLGYDLLLDLLKMLTPTLLVNIRIEGALSFQVPTIYHPITVNFRRIEVNSNSASAAPSPHLVKPAVLRAFSTAGYLAQCFRLFGTSPTAECGGLILRYASQLRLADLPVYRVRFASVGIYLHPEMPPIDDHLILSALNCAIVGLCEEVEMAEEENENGVVRGGSIFKRRRFLDDDHLPMRFTLNNAVISQSNCSSDNNVSRKTWRLTSEGGADQQSLPLLRCYGHAMIRAIDPDQKLFYLLTPVDVSVLKERVKVLAVGHELQATSVLFDGKGKEPAPYLVEFERRVTISQRKMLSPLTNVKPFRLGYGKKRHTSNGVQKTAVGQRNFSR